MKHTKLRFVLALAVALITFTVAPAFAQDQNAATPEMATAQFWPNPNSPYLTVGGEEFYVRSMNRAWAVEYPPRIAYYDDGGRGHINFTYRAAQRTTPGKARVFIAFSNWLESGRNVFRVGFNWSNPYAGPSSSPTDNNTFVLAEAFSDGSTRETFLSAVQMNSGIHVTIFNGTCLNSVCAPMGGEATIVLPRDEGGDYTEYVRLSLTLVAGRNALAIIGRPATTDWCPTCEFGISLGLLRGEAEARPMLGDAMAFAWRYDRNQLWVKLNAFARNERILWPWTGQEVSATSQEVWRFLATFNPWDRDEVRRAMAGAILAQLVALANKLDVKTTSVGQRVALDAELWRSSATEPDGSVAATAGETILHGACSIHSFAERVERAYRKFQADQADRADFVHLAAYLAQW